MNNDEIRNIYEYFNQILNKVTYSHDVEYVTLKLLFLKYVVDNYIGAYTKEDLMLYGKMHKVFAQQDNISGSQVVRDILSLIDERCEITKNGFSLLESELPVTFDAILFGNAPRQRKVNYGEDACRVILGELGRINLEESEDNSVGEMIVECFRNQLETMSRSTYTGTFATGRELSRVASKLLCVSNTDEFLDFAAGVGASTIEMTKNGYSSIVCMDNNADALLILMILFILGKRENATICHSDTLRHGNNSDIKADKIFVDVPLGLKISTEGTNVDAYSLVTTWINENALNDNGRAVITYPANMLFQTKGKIRAIKSALFDKQMIKAVISLPPLWLGTGSNTNLIVYEKNRTGGIMMIDASRMGEKKRWGYSLAESTIQQIANAVEKNIEEEGFAKIVSIKKIEDNEMNISPSIYVKPQSAGVNISVSEIDEQLKSLYEKLGQL